MFGVLYGRNPDESDGEIHIWSTDLDTAQSECEQHECDVIDVDNSAIKVSFNTQSKVLRVIQKESLSRPLNSYCEECIQNCDRLDL